MPGLFFHQKLDSIAKITRDKWGDRTSAIIYQSIPCRFTEDDTKIREATVEDERIDALAYIGKRYTVAVDYVVTFESQDYIITKIAKARDLFGNVHHQKLLLKSR